jgi:hypothetical protein
MSEPKTIELDFLSGDYACANALTSARHAARYLAARNMPWDLISWGHNALPGTWRTHNRSTKEENQYKQEASIVLALGGGFQFFNIAYCGGGYIQKWAIPIWENTAKFCREREFCFKAKPYSNIAIMVPYQVTPTESKNLYSAGNSSLMSYKTWMSALCDIQLSPNVILESELENTDLSDYQLIVLPNSASLLPAAKEKLLSFVKNGGKVVTDILSANNFTDITGIDTSSAQRKLRFISDGNALAAFETDVIDTLDCKNTYGDLYSQNYFEFDSIKTPSAYVTPLNDGKIYSLAFDFTDTYDFNVSTVIKNWLKALFDNANINQFVKVSGSSFIEVITTRKNDDLLVNLINLTGDHRIQNVRNYNEIVPLYNLTIEVDKKREIFIEPEHKKMTSNTLEKLEIHTTLIVKDYFK